MIAFLNDNADPATSTSINRCVSTFIRMTSSMSFYCSRVSPFIEHMFQHVARSRPCPQSNVGRRGTVRLRRRVWFVTSHT